MCVKNQTKPKSLPGSPIHIRHSDKSWGRYKDRIFASGSYRCITKYNVTCATTELSLNFTGTQRRVQLTGEGGRLHREGGISGGSALKRNQILSEIKKDTPGIEENICKSMQVRKDHGMTRKTNSV